ncbi:MULTISPECIES: 2'-5' RNA ligase family protein [unclassified Acinetobacter]|uniref:2'-5' RNA ligase family protein n=1 Tax=unclassified Acinetobacter TaxID=196816 RepID=UPI00190CD9BD|nr:MULTISPECIES: 2'-5' RNA ligase family protein [unclassified Acinetobacter]MBK0063206.1 2'-5' RNA ligase family protein [Acinetobacter sp. S55]MBK0066882.1 2'-5' RNA ligase family protein [Acinetobacter sp. S54]
MYLKSHGWVIPTLSRDYPEWHRGRTTYALWYILIDREKYPELVDKLDQLQASFSDLLLKNTQRQYHITLYICGFLTEQKPLYNDDFSMQCFEQQRWQLLNQCNKTSFQLEIRGLNSFTSALFINVNDDNNQLTDIRQKLHLQDHQEIAALQYHPHITLGLYRDAYPSQQILNRMQKTPEIDLKITIDQLHFGYYQAQQLQSPLHSVYCLQLE